MSTRDELLAKAAYKKQKTFVDEELGEVRLRGLTGAERKLFAREYNVGCPQEHSGTEFLTACGLIDQHGENLFSLDDLDTVADLPFQALGRIAVEVAKLSGIIKESAEEVEKN